MRQSHLLSLTIAGLLLAGCSQESAVTTSEPVVRTEESGAQRVTMSLGQTATFGTTNPLRITLRSIEADSRCPVDVQCVWAGDAAVLLRLERGTVRAGTTLHTALEPRRIFFDEQSAIRLVEVTPLPREGTPVAAAAYRVTLEVTPP